MKHVWSTFIILLFFTLKPSLARIECNSNDNCLCLQGHGFEIQCPKFYDDNGYIIHIKETEQVQILIDCAENLIEFDINLLPNITIDKVDNFQMRFCPLPKNGFKDIFDHFSIKQVDYFQYSSYNLSDVVLRKEYFQGLEFLKGLKLNNVGLVNVEPDVFANTPNLISLDLQANQIILPPNLFENTPLLGSLDLSQNQLEDIPDGLFKNLYKLSLLHLWGNKIQKINDFTFSGLQDLKSLELSLNKIENISENAFKTLTNLTQINLSRNRLEFLFEDTFSHNLNLQKVLIRNNEAHLQLPQHAFANLSSLEEIDLENSNIDNIPTNIFENSINIKNITLERNKLSTIPENVFNGLSNINKILLSHNGIEKIGNAFKSLRKLKILHIQHNLITEIDDSDFEDLVNLEEINLKRNKIEKINDKAFYYNEKLKWIDLSHNRYSGKNRSLHINIFDIAKDTEFADFSYNKIEDIGDVINLYNKPKLRELDLSHNSITYIYVQDLQPLAEKLTINLEHNKITTVNFTLVDAITQNINDAYSIRKDEPISHIKLANNPLSCDCRNYDLVKYYRDDLRPQVKVMFDIETTVCVEPKELENYTIEDLSPQLLLCSFEQFGLEHACSNDCSCKWRPHDKSVVINCSDRNLTEYPEMDLSQVTLDFNQTEMHLERNSLVEGLNENLIHYTNVTKLYLSWNEIQNISWLPPQLEILHLDHNNVTHLDSQILNTLNKSSLLSLTLNNNPWQCDCDAVPLTNFLRQHTQIISYKDTVCSSNSSLLLMDLNKNDLCKEWTVVNTIVIILIFFLFLLAIVALFGYYQMEVKVWLYAHNLCLCWVTEEELDKDKIYDAFISYSHKDEDFVVQNLLPVLEGGPQPYKLCLHYRNWVPGEFITTQVTNSVLESRRTLVVLSTNFLESVWGRMEFRTAHTEAMTEGRARVIIVLYGDIDMEKLDDELKTYMKTNTYVKWGDPYFWNKLKYALPHLKRKVSKNNNQKIANVMRCIDDKFNLVTPVTPNPGSTPPVLALDANGLKKHPLNFVTSQDVETPPAEAGNLLVSTCL